MEERVKLLGSGHRKFRPNFVVVPASSVRLFSLTENAGNQSQSKTAPFRCKTPSGCWYWSDFAASNTRDEVKQRHKQYSQFTRVQAAASGVPTDWCHRLCPNLHMVSVFFFFRLLGIQKFRISHQRSPLGGSSRKLEVSLAGETRKGGSRRGDTE